MVNTVFSNFPSLFGLGVFFDCLSEGRAGGSESYRHNRTSSFCVT